MKERDNSKHVFLLIFGADERGSNSRGSLTSGQDQLVDTMILLVHALADATRPDDTPGIPRNTLFARERIEDR